MVDDMKILAIEKEIPGVNEKDFKSQLNAVKLFY